VKNAKDANVKNKKLFVCFFFASFAPQGHLSLRSGTFFADWAFLFFLEYPARLRRGGLFLKINLFLCAA